MDFGIDFWVIFRYSFDCCQNFESKPKKENAPVTLNSDLFVGSIELKEINCFSRSGGCFVKTCKLDGNELNNHCFLVP